MNQLRGQRRQSLILAMRPAVLDLGVLALDIAGVLQTLVEGLPPAAESIRARNR